MHFTIDRRSMCAWAGGMALCLASLGAQSQSMFNDHDPGWYLQAAMAARGAHASSLGVTLPWQQWTYALGSGQATGHWDLSASYWSSSMPSGRQHGYLVGVVPTLRWRGDQGQAAWFVQAGTGPTWASQRYQSHDKRFSTRYNFATHLAWGIHFSSRRAHELMVRVEHFSNASLRKPNPGENFLQLRYARKF